MTREALAFDTVSHWACDAMSDHESGVTLQHFTQFQEVMETLAGAILHELPNRAVINRISAEHGADILATDYI